MDNSKNIIVLGCTGMLGSTIIKYLDLYSKHNIFGLCRKKSNKLKLNNTKIIDGIDLDDLDGLKNVIFKLNPDFIINCIGVIKQKKSGIFNSDMVKINSLFPHILNEYCIVNKTFLIHFSTDCVYSGKKGNYTEQDIPDPIDLYGKSKLAGEPSSNYCLVFRTSIIGHELKTNKSLINWFLAQNKSILGYTKAFFSGLPTVLIAEVVTSVLNKINTNNTGLYNLSSNKISKYDLLTKVSEIYGHKIQINPSDDLIIDRSLNSVKFQKKFSYKILDWDSQLLKMFKFK